jgi:hypothetical protein
MVGLPPSSTFVPSDEQATTADIAIVNPTANASGRVVG